MVLGAGGEGTGCGGSAGVAEVATVGDDGSGTSQYLCADWWCVRLTRCILGF